MPSNTFLNLSKEKQKIIIEASIKEFSRVPLKDASINKIVKTANISRGSFYTYFNNIDDLYFYAIDSYKEKLYTLNMQNYIYKMVLIIGYLKCFLKLMFLI